MPLDLPVDRKTYDRETESKGLGCEVPDAGEDANLGSPPMNMMIESDPMWVDPGMIRAQERYQDQFDRMLARR